MVVQSYPHKCATINGFPGVFDPAIYFVLQISLKGTAYVLHLIITFLLRWIGFTPGTAVI